MIKSMTAFAGAEKTDHGISTAVEIRGVNSRYLDMAVRMPASYSGLEDFIKQAVSKKAFRGRIEIRVTIKEPGAETRDFAVNKPLAEAYYNALNELRRHLDINEPAGLSHIVNISGIIETVENEKNLEAVRSLLASTLKEALETFDDMRKAEGRAMAEDLFRRLEFVEQCIDHIDNLRQGLLEYYHKRLQKRIRELTGDAAEIDHSRIAQEAAVLADKSDISEELTRAKSHVQQFRHIMEGEEPGGKPLNFLLQEFSREFNTMGVKAANADISHTVVSAKTELEKLREQVQNIE
ncbi:MAG: YicC family protein [Desulfobacteraceae bacterium]|nr:YicC family protein [Desulfobacteraceae bacterium]MCF8095370.1 YicC family protein [Desulfobacteraceae bacterium]